VRIGRTIVEALSARGAGVVIHYRQSRAEAEALRRRLVQQGGRAWTIGGNLTSGTVCRIAYRDSRKQSRRADRHTREQRRRFSQGHLRHNGRPVAPGRVRNQSLRAAPLVAIVRPAETFGQGRSTCWTAGSRGSIPPASLPASKEVPGGCHTTRGAGLCAKDHRQRRGARPRPATARAGKNYLKDKAGAIPLQRICPARRSGRRRPVPARTGCDHRTNHLRGRRSAPAVKSTGNGEATGMMEGWKIGWLGI